MLSTRLKEVILRELRLPDMDLREEMLASEVPGWDSLTHVKILAAVEREFAIRLGGLEVMRLKNIGQLDQLVAKKMAGGR